MTVQVASLFAKISADSTSLEKSLKGVKSDLTSTEKGFASFQKTVTVGFKAAGLAAAAAFAAFGAGMVASVKAAARMEQGVADIGAVMSLTAAETANLQDHIFDLGLDPTLKVSATEASNAIMSLGTAGLNMAQIMGGASEATVLLANATGGDMASSASLMTDVMAQYGITAGETGRIVDQLTGLTVASKFSFQDAALAFGQVGGVAGSLGLTLEDTNAILGATAYNFNSGSDAATSMKTFLQRLIPTTNEAEDALDQLGIMAGGDGVSGAFFTANGMMRSAEEIAGNLQSAFAGLSDAQRNEAASTIFGTDAMRTALALVEGGTPAITKFKDEVAKVDAGEMASKRMNTFAGAIEIAQGVVETISISIGQKFLPVLRPLVERFAEMAQVYGPKLIDFFGRFAEKVAHLIGQGMEWGQRVLPPLWEKMQQIGTAINTVTGLVMQAIAPITKAIGGYIKWHDILLAVAGLLTGAVIAAIGGFLVALAPVVLLVAKVALGIANMRNIWESNFLGIQDVVDDVLNFISKFINNHTSIWKGTWGKTLAYFTTNSKEAWTKLRDDIVGKFRDWTREVRHVVETWIDVTERKLNNWITTTGYAIARWRDWGIRYFREFAESAGEKIEQFLGYFIPQEWIDKGKSIIQGLWDGIKQKWQNLRDWFTGVWGDLTDRFKKFFGIHSPSTLFRTYGEDMMAGLREGIDAGSGMVFDSMDAMNDGIAGKLKAIDGLIDMSQSAMSQKAWDNLMKFYEEASKPTLPDWAKPGYVPPPSTMPPVLADPNSGAAAPSTTPVKPAIIPIDQMAIWLKKTLKDASYLKFSNLNILDTLKTALTKTMDDYANNSNLVASGVVQGAISKLLGGNLGGMTVGHVVSQLEGIVERARYEDQLDGRLDPQMERNNELLTILIQELRNKNMSANFNLVSGGSYSDLVAHVSGMKT